MRQPIIFHFRLTIQHFARMKAQHSRVRLKRTSSEHQKCTCTISASALSTHRASASTSTSALARSFASAITSERAVDSVYSQRNQQCECTSNKQVWLMLMQVHYLVRMTSAPTSARALATSLNSTLTSAYDSTQTNANALVMWKCNGSIPDQYIKVEVLATHISIVKSSIINFICR